ncbi:uncharacterized protein P174DRAFT_447590 [Aspergillus novofumigatus IBT 16806]|uniref:Protein ZIP4 homolog n=1 Tax=Aspergillus novofumigatus (strain IBT 16806) TaxID=1392255 RepID=A0A2I1CN25_ASPN1|nr:uncharacterized protein P174DRAFT_447590 [Aspergillus novofumigatus IBT 16806]PKX99034.1 hypothetical protein P174DRAFT_447590 [Aspergillus novofumigatus IBT 16806]
MSQPSDYSSNRCDFGTMTSKDLEERSLNVLALAKQIQSWLSNASTSEQSQIADTSIELLDNYLGDIPSFTAAPSSTIRRQLDTEGTKLWNTCTQLMAISADNSKLRLLSKVKALAFAMLDCAASAHNQGNSRSFELALRAARTCMDQEQLDLSQKIIGIAATRLNDMCRNQSSQNRAKVETYMTEYYMLRVYLSWLQGRSDIAEHLFSKVPQASRGGHLETVMDICYQVGAQEISRRQLDVAARWLERALSSCELLQHETQQVNPDLKDKRLRVLVAFVWVSLHLDSADAKFDCDRAVACLKSEYDDAFEAQVLQLEIYSKENISDYDEYAEILRRAIAVLELNDADLKNILYFIHKLKEFRIKQLLHDKLAVSDKRAWTERVFISLVRALTESYPCALDCIAVMKDVAQSLLEFGLQSLSEGTTNACLILVWKHIDTAMSNGDISHAERCCEFLLEQPLFQISSDSKGKILRKLISCSRDDPSTLEGHKVIVRHLEECKASASTLYMLYGVALRNDDYTLGQTCLTSLSELGQEGKIYLFSCAAEARRSGNTRFTIECLQQLITGMDDNSLGEVPVSTLFQYVLPVYMAMVTELIHCIILLSQLLAPEDRGNAASIAHLISTFEEALKRANNEGRLPLYSASELEWFARKSYNIALDIHRTSPSETVLHLLEISLEFTDLYHKKTGTKDRIFIYLLAEYIKCSKLIADARGHTPSSAKAYKQIRQSVQHFETHIQAQLDTCKTAPEREVWTHKYRPLLALDFEAAIDLKQWNDIPSIIERTSTILDDQLCSVFLDCILRSGTPAPNIAQVVKDIICIFHSSPSPSFDAGAFHQKLPRYLRCLFQTALEAKDYSLTESVLHQAVVLARDNSADTDLPFVYPSDELKWLATMAFNRAVDLYLASADEDCRKWGEIAFTLADLIKDDGGALLRMLRQNYAKLM